MFARCSGWLILAGFVSLSLASFGQPTTLLYDSGHSYRGFNPLPIDGCNDPSHLCHYHAGMNGWGNDAPIKEFNYRGFNGSTLVEFMNWRMLFPVGYKWDGSVSYPMILMLHGSGESGRIGTCCFQPYPANDPKYDNNDHHLLHSGLEHQTACGYNSAGNPAGTVRFPGIVVWPQSSFNASWEAGWNNGELQGDNETAVRILEWIIKNPKYHVDPDRIAVHGLSSGARGSWDIAAKRPDLFAAVLPMSGVGNNYAAMTDTLVTTKIWLFQGSNDTNPNPGSATDMINMFLQKGGNPRFTIYPNRAHDTWPLAYAETDFFPFILSANKKNIYVFGGDPSICSGGSLKLGMSAGYKSYQWTLNGANISSGGNSRYYNATIPGVYTCKFTRTVNNSSGESFALTVSPKTSSTFVPTMTSTGSTQIVIDKSGVNNEVNLTAPLGYSNYYWNKNGSETILTANTYQAAFGVGQASQAGVYKVRVKLPSGCLSDYSPSLTVVYHASQPSTGGTNAPTIVGTTATTTNLSWNNVAGETGYEIWRFRFGAGSYAFQNLAYVTAVPANTTTYIDNGLRPQAQYRYYIRAVLGATGAVFSPESQTATTGADINPPSVPTGLVASNIGEDQFTLTWNPSTDNDAVYKYEVYNGATLLTTLTGSAEGTVAPVNSATFTGQPSSTNYFLSVRAIDYKGNYSSLSEVLQMNTTGSQGGLTYKYYTFAGTLPGGKLVEPMNNSFDFSQTPARTGTISTFDISGANTFQGVADPNNFVYAFDGFINITVAGNYRFYTSSDDGSRLYLNGSLLVNNDGDHGTQELNNNVAPYNNVDIPLTVGKIPIRVTYYEQGGGNVLTVSWARTNNTPFTKTPIPASVLFLTGTTIKNYYLTTTATDPSLVASWTSSPNGIGGTAPANFSDPLQYFTIANQGAVTLANPWTVSGAGSKVIVGNGTNAITLNLNAAFTGTMDAAKTATINVANATMPSFSVLDATSTVNFNIAGTIPNANYGNVNLQVASLYTLPLSTTTVQGNLTAVSGATTAGTANNLSVLRVGGDISFASNPFPVSAGQKYSLVFTGGKTHTVNFATPIDPALYAVQADAGDSIVFANAGAHTYTFGTTQGGGLVLKSNAKINLGSNNLIVTGLGTINPNGENGRIAINGGNLTLTTTAAQSSNIYLNPYNNQNAVNNLTVSTSTNSSIQIQSPARVANLVTLSGGILNSTNGSLTLLSDGSGSARIGPITGGASITGSITAQRYMDAVGRNYRYISSPVRGVKVSDLQNYTPITGTFEGATKGSGLSNAYSMFTYNEPDYVNFPATTNQDTLRKGKGYALFIREAANPTTWSAVGTPYQGNVAFTLTGGTGSASNGWNLIGNPYPSAIQWTGAQGASTWPQFSGVSNTVYVRHNFGTQFQWYVYRPGISTPPTGQAILAGGIIAAGQAFWVQSTIASPSLTIAEGAKFTTNGGTFYRTQNDSPDVLSISMANGQLEDVAYILHEEEGTEKYEKTLDAVKQPNSFFNLSTRSSDGILLAINSTPSTFCEKDVRLNIENAATGNYSLEFHGLDKFQRQMKIVLTDNFTGTSMEIAEGKKYDFSITTDPNSTGPARFVINEKTIVLTNSTVKTNQTCESNPTITILNTQPGVSYQGLFSGGTVSSLVKAQSSDSVKLTLDRHLLGFGTHMITLAAGYDGCGSKALDQTISVEIDTLEAPSIQYQSGFLTAIPADADDYQWFLDGEKIKGQSNSRIANSGELGNYQVEVTSGACSKLSSVLSITGIDTDPNSTVKAYPNPFRDKIVVTLPEKFEGGTVMLLNTIGQRAYSTHVAPQSSNEVTLNFGGVDAGAYVLNIGRYKFKVIKVN